MPNETIIWDCPKCQAHMKDEIHPEMGPFNSCLCDNCDEWFDQVAVPGLIRKDATPCPRT